MKKYLIIAVFFAFTSCGNKYPQADGYGNFEADETVVSAESAGKILFLDVDEGSVLDKGKLVAIIDTGDLQLRKEQLIAQKKAVESKAANVTAQIEVQKQQKNNLLTDKVRTENLFKEGAATAKQLDDINGAVALVEKQILSTETQMVNISNEINVIEKQIAQLEENINKCSIVNPVKGTVLEKYAEVFELTAPGKSLYKIAVLDYLYLRAYISGAQLAQVKLGQKVQVNIDAGENTMRQLEGEISWIASVAEFTPKIIQTREERINLVYAIKIKTPNDGSLKIGMPGEVVFLND